MIIALKELRTTLTLAQERISSDWRCLGIDSDHYLSESLAALTIELEENIDLVNQAIGERT
jgi:hypothetical protein